jgi:hypothetical protein
LYSPRGKRIARDLKRDDWGGYERVLPPEIKHHIGKDKTQRCSCVLTALSGNKLGDGIGRRTSERKVWDMTKVTTRLVVSYNKMDLAA